MLTRKDHGTKVRDRLIAYIEHKLDLRPDEITERKTRIKRYNRTQIFINRLELQFHDLYSYILGILK